MYVSLETISPCFPFRELLAISEVKQLVAISGRMSWANRKLPMLMGLGGGGDVGMWGCVHVKMGSRDSGVMMPLISCTALLILRRRPLLVAPETWS